MHITTYKTYNWFSEQTEPKDPYLRVVSSRPNYTRTEKNEGLGPQAVPSGPEEAARRRLLKQMLLRDQIQSAIQELIRGYEVTTGMSVVRIDVHADRVVLDAVPTVK